tara:strand:+ start:650 stop:1357 length:708 start_codon:yes stop_codon:yes gene_type:complete
MPYICMIRTDISDGTLQILDLWPNTSQRSAIYDPEGQSKYIDRGEFTGTGANAANGRPTTVAATAHATNYACYGLAAYIADNVASTISGNTVPDSIANLMATALLAILDAGGVLNLAAINTAMQGTAGAQGDETLTAAGGTGSVGSVAEVLQICAGGSYLLPSGSPEDVTSVGYARAGAFEAGTFRHTYDTGALKISFGEGKLSEVLAAAYDPFGDGTTGAGVAVYADDGTVYTG